MSKQTPLKVFVSHAQRDGEFAHALAEQLVNRGLDVWRPEVEILPGDNWHAKMADALEGASAMVVVVSPDTAKSEEVGRELQYAYMQPRFEGRLVPVIAHATDEMPWVLEKLRPIDASSEGLEGLGEQVAAALSNE